jgi:ferredoxin, 2Fe-2S
MPKITFYPTGQGGDFLPETNLLEAAQQCGLEIAHECGGFASCSTCRVFIKSGEQNLSAIEFDEEDMLDLAELSPPYRLACQAKIRGDVEVQIPENSKEEDVRLNAQSENQD